MLIPSRRAKKARIRVVLHMQLGGVIGVQIWKNVGPQFFIKESEFPTKRCL